MTAKCVSPHTKSEQSQEERERNGLGTAAACVRLLHKSETSLSCCAGLWPSMSKSNCRLKGENNWGTTDPRTALNMSKKKKPLLGWIFQNKHIYKWVAGHITYQRDPFNTASPSLVTILGCLVTLWGLKGFFFMTTATALAFHTAVRLTVFSYLPSQAVI